MTTNLIECINSVLNDARNFPMLALVRATYYWLNELFTRKNAEEHDRKLARFTYSLFATQRIEANFDRRNELFEVCEMPNEKASSVDLARRTVDYGHFQVERLPCHHIIGCCANQRLNWQVYVNDVYMMTDIRKVYNIDFVPLGDLQTCRSYSGLTLVAYLTLRRMSKGRPKLTRYLNEMDSRQMYGLRIYCLCGRQGHSHSRCPQHAGPSGVGDSGRP
ncbi:hypothetical protein Ahy_A01g003431 [Arachis hypogaea]|uniref:CCHC-type domain-containing protein n=1 Tax=Arachis hypogaea TaxID=3818 RepID=A0A445ETB6_ARAHY|nr:hypothetical protein Ahy_A01g003431 [Arachis hypogaea]